MSYDQAVLRSQQAGGAFTFATLPTASQMQSEPQGIMAYTTDQGLVYWSGSGWFAVGNTGGFTGAYLSASPTSGENDNFNPGGGFPGTINQPIGRLDLTPPASCNLTGLLAGMDGQIIVLRNPTAFTITLNNQNSSSSAANQFSAFDDVVMPPNTTVTGVYYGGSINKWVVGL